MKIFKDDEDERLFIEHISELGEAKWHPHKEPEKGPLLFTKEPAETPLPARS